MLTPEQRRLWALYTPETLKVRVRELGASDFLIKGILPARSIAMLLGDSGLGKSPLIYQPVGHGNREAPALFRLCIHKVFPAINPAEHRGLLTALRADICGNRRGLEALQ